MIPAAAIPARRGRYRWVICALLFFATAVNYMDRQVIGLLKSTLMTELHWSEVNYGNIITAFSAAYAIGYGGGGWFMDRVGVRLGYAGAVLLWSVAAMGHAFVRTVPGFGVMRSVLGLAEGGNFPAAIRTVSEWFPKRERALATGIFNAGCNVAVIVTPLLIPWLTKRWGWQTAFFVTGALGLVWLAAWGLMFRRPQDHARLSPVEVAYIQSDPPDVEAKISWRQLLRHRQTWMFTVAMVLVSPVWWFYLFWVPGFLHDRHGLDLANFGPPLIVIYLIADLGSIGGGWLSSWLLQRGWSLNAARKTAMLVCALCVLPVFAASSVSDLWTATVLIGVAAAAHQGFAANLYTLVSDAAPRRVVGSIVGIGGMAAGVAGIFTAQITGYVLQWTGSYRLLFGGASIAYLTALLAIHLINPRLDPMKPASGTAQ